MLVKLIVISVTLSSLPLSTSDTSVDAPEEKITDHLALQQILKALPEEDQRLIYYRYFKNQTQTETAKRLGTTQVQISRREKKLLLRLRGLLL